MLQEQLHSANTRADMAEQRAAEADGLSVQLAQLQSHQQTWDKVLQVSHLQLYTMWVLLKTCMRKHTPIRHRHSDSMQWSCRDFQMHKLLKMF